MHKTPESRPFRRTVAARLFLAAAILLVAAKPDPGRTEESGADKKAPKPKPSAEALAWVDEITRNPPGEHAGIRPLAIFFDLSWNNVLFAGELAVALDRKSEDDSPGDQVLIGAARGRSTGLARVLWSYDVVAKGLVDPVSLRPHLFELSEIENEKSVDYVLDFQPGKVVSVTTAAPKKPDEKAEPKSRNYRFKFLQDVLSAALYLRSQPLDKGDRIRILVSPFNRPYYVEFLSRGKEKRKVHGKTYDTFCLDVNIRKINHDKTLQDYDKLKKATFWLTDDEFRLPLEIHADIFVGFVSARMKDRFWLSPEQADGTATIPEPTKSGLSGFFESAGDKLFGGKKEKKKPEAKKKD